MANRGLLRAAALTLVLVLSAGCSAAPVALSVDGGAATASLASTTRADVATTVNEESTAVGAKTTSVATTTTAAATTDTATPLASTPQTHRHHEGNGTTPTPHNTTTVPTTSHRHSKKEPVSDGGWLHEHATAVTVGIAVGVAGLLLVVITRSLSKPHLKITQASLQVEGDFYAMDDDNAAAATRTEGRERLLASPDHPRNPVYE